MRIVVTCQVQAFSQHGVSKSKWCSIAKSKFCIPIGLDNGSRPNRDFVYPQRDNALEFGALLCENVDNLSLTGRWSLCCDAPSRYPYESGTK
jgi:hypothetical protein